MMRITYSLVALAALLISLPAMAEEPAERATEELKSQSDRSIYIVQKRAYSKSGDIEISPFAFTKLNPKFVGYAGIGLSVAYHIKENFAVELTVGKPFGFYSALVYDVFQYEQLTPEDVDLKLMRFYAAGSLQFSALYGKLELYGMLLDYDFYAMAGFGFATTVEPCAPPGAGDCSEGQDATGKGLQRPERAGDAMKLTGNIGGGMRVFFHDMFGLRIEIRDIAYADRVVVPGGVTTDIRNNLMISLGVAFMLPGPTSVAPSKEGDK